MPIAEVDPKFIPNFSQLWFFDDKCMASNGSRNLTTNEMHYVYSKFPLDMGE